MTDTRPGRTRRVAASACIVVAAVATIWRTLPPRALPDTAPPTAFSAERALAHIASIATAPRPTGSPENAAVRGYILAELDRLGLETTTQPAGELVNVMGRIPGARSADAVLLTAHLDSTPQSLGVMDDASGVAALLETARALQAGAPLPNTVIFLFTDAEEGGLLGARAFVADHPWAHDARVVVGFDAGGWNGPVVLSDTSPNNGWLVRQLIQADPYLVDSSAINGLGYSSTDFGRAFKPAGFSGFAFDLYWDKRDKPDTIEEVSLATLQHQGYHALALAQHFGRLDALDDPREPDAIYFSVLRLFVVHYTPGLGRGLAVFALIVFGFALRSGLRRSSVSWRGMAFGAVVMAACALAAALPALLLEHIGGRWLPRLTAEWDYRLIDQPIPMGAIALTGVVLAVLVHSRAHRSGIAVPDLLVGGLAVLAAGMVVTATVVPSISYAFTWPLLVSLAVWLNGLRRGGVRADRASPVWLLSSAAGIVILGPVIVLGLFDKPPLALALLGVLRALLLPQLRWSGGFRQATRL